LGGGSIGCTVRRINPANHWPRRRVHVIDMIISVGRAWKVDEDDGKGGKTLGTEKEGGSRPLGLDMGDLVL